MDTNPFGMRPLTQTQPAGELWQLYVRLATACDLLDALLFDVEHMLGINPLGSLPRPGQRPNPFG